MLNCTAQVCLLNMKTMLFNTPVTLILAVKAVKDDSGQWVERKWFIPALAGKHWTAVSPSR